MITIDRDLCRDYARSSQLEWLETNGKGGFAMGTVAGVNARRYHGLLIAALQPPLSRSLLLSRLDEVMEPGLELSSHQYPGALWPQGYQRLLGFRLDPFPCWTFDVDGAQLEKQLFLVPGEQAVVVQYRVTQPRRMRVTPLLAFRDDHALTHQNAALDGAVQEERGPGALVLRLRPYAALPAMCLSASPTARFASEGGWLLHHEYLLELSRGLDYREDLWKPGTLELDLRPGQPAFVAATLGEGVLDAASVLRLEALVREQRRPRGSERFRAALETAAAQFVVRGDPPQARPTVIAGYPWFTDWGRDTMISLPGCLLSLGRLDEAREVLRGFLGFLEQGLIPNRFPDRPGEPLEFNTVDATLWLFQAAHALLERRPDPELLRSTLYPAALEIIGWHQRGTRHGIGVDPADHLLAAGAPGVALTWMDARVDGRPITPRHGKPVEINALWYNALRLAAGWGRALRDEPRAAAFDAEADAVAVSFRRAFWNEARGCLHDVVSPVDASVRPNQLIALSLAFPLFAGEQARSIVGVAGRHLLTPFGLRTLAPFEPGYLGHYRGGPAERDAAYHQGTVWPWLMGPYVRAYLHAFGRSAQALEHCRDLLRPLERHLAAEACLGSVSEVFDGEAPHLPAGAPAQAWSVAELLQLLADSDAGDTGAHSRADSDADSGADSHAGDTDAGDTDAGDTDAMETR